MAGIIYKFSEDFNLRVRKEPLQVALEYLLYEYEGVKNLSTVLGVSRNVVNLWLKDIKKPNDENLQKICRLIKVEKNVIKNW
jgi:hypothetical protein